MGSGSSRLGSGQDRTRVSRRSKLMSSLICGGSSSRVPVEMEDCSDENLMTSAESYHPVLNGVQNTQRGTSLISCTGTQFTSSNTETGTSSGSSIAASEDTSAEGCMRIVETSNHGKCLADSKELVSPLLVSAESSHDDYRDIATTSFKEQESSDHLCVNDSANKNAVNGIDNSVDKGVSHICHEPSSSSSQSLGDSRSNGVSLDSLASEISATHDSHSDTVSHVSDLPVTFHSLGDESIRGAMPAGLGFLVSNREQDRPDGSVLHVDVVSISSHILSSGSADTSSHAARRNSRRLFWDAFSRRSSRRLNDSPTILFSTDDTNDLGSQDRWLLDFSGDFLDDGVGGDSGYLGLSVCALLYPAIWERLRAGLDDNRRTSFCPSGLHPDGTCSCESFVMSEESSTRAISRIVMLAEALFEVLDEIHRQPVSLSLSMVSLPAPESVVDSFPLKSHKKAEKAESGDDVEQVCPLCRGDVRQLATEASNSEIPSV
ncbi:hypothetical protein JRO89_XS06G0110400 [Xanthoceras sorbifolium]|uniref:Uncharacterized protein n=1 Tax=Xanthoceras sorbifolium TaxID=99658 RepID=A0ABQ8HY19_9ROSI|nr:hypothetical protein JRO89_XS06G0110400 [Xanthoceras sorbifolium]